VNLLPLNPEGMYSDGAQIYQLLKGGAWADLHNVISVAGATTVTALRPRDFDIEAIRRAERSLKIGRPALVLRLIATSYYLDCERFEEAREALAEAEAVYAASGMDLPAEICMGFVYRIAFLRRDAASARAWWERMEAKKPSTAGVDYWLAKSALLWSEERVEEAREAWEKGNALAKNLPQVGDGEFDRHRCQLLGRELEVEAMATAG
jgi:tetratricopeptide (TPR) repeat protein